MNFYGQLISCHDHLWSNEFAVPCNGFWLFFSPRQSIFSPKFAAAYVALYRRFEPLATSFVRPRFLDNHTSTPLIFFRLIFHQIQSSTTLNYPFFQAT